MAVRKDKLTLKKQPVQQRSIFMIDSIKEAATRVLKTKGIDNFNTNVVAELAGVSIGSFYQYFDSKETLIAEIKRDHFNDLRSLFAKAEVNLKTNDIRELTNAFVDASVEGHRVDPELHRILSDDFDVFEVKEKDHSTDSILNKVSLALVRYEEQLRPNLDIDSAANLVYHLVEKTVHDTVLNTSDITMQNKRIEELKRMILTYLCEPST